MLGLGLGLGTDLLFGARIAVQDPWDVGSRR